MVPAVGIEPTRCQDPRDFECGNRFLYNPLILVWLSRNLAKDMKNLISIYSSLFCLFQSFWFIFSTILAQSASGFQPEGLYFAAQNFSFQHPGRSIPPWLDFLRARYLRTVLIEKRTSSISSLIPHFPSFTSRVFSSTLVIENILATTPVAGLKTIPRFS